MTIIDAIKALNWRIKALVRDGRYTDAIPYQAAVVSLYARAVSEVKS